MVTIRYIFEAGCIHLPLWYQMPSWVVFKVHPTPAAGVSPGSMLEMHIFSPYPYGVSISGSGPGIWVPLGLSWFFWSWSLRDADIASWCHSSDQLTSWRCPCLMPLWKLGRYHELLNKWIHPWKHTCFTSIYISIIAIISNYISSSLGGILCWLRSGGLSE